MRAKHAPGHRCSCRHHHFQRGAEVVVTSLLERGRLFGIMKTILLLICSNVFMTFAWYGHLKYRKAPLIAAIVVSWLIAFFEYCFQVPANRLGYGEFTAFQLKIIQEVITLCVFVVFAWFYLGEEVRWNHAVSFAFLVGAVIFGFWGKT
jgi:uncharacterized protein